MRASANICLLLLVVVSAAAVASAAVSAADGSSASHPAADLYRVAFRLTDMTAAAVEQRDAAVAAHAAFGSHRQSGRQHWSIEDVATLFGTTDKAMDALQLRLGQAPYAVAAPALSRSVTRDTMTVSVVAPQSALGQTLGLAAVQMPMAGPRAVSVPADLAALGVHSVLVTKLRRSQPSKKKATTVAGAFPGAGQTPFTLRGRYSIPNATIVTTTNATQAVAEFEGEQFYQANVDAFFARYASTFAPTNVSVVGPNNGGYFGEGNLDLEYICGLAQGSPTAWVAENEFDMTSWIEKFLSVSPIPTVASISWGSGESGFDVAGIASDTEHFRKLALLGVSVLAASGDQGTGTTGFWSCGKFDPNWPASCPYVTAVGATYSDDAAGGSETAWSGSGGGFSIFYGQQGYQASAVTAYLNGSTGATLPAATYWNATGRGTPDVAALGTNFAVYSGGWGEETGTSAATPTFAGIITRINADRAQAGKPSLGFLNPTLYGLGRVGYDVTSGDNKNPSCPAGFAAAPGWDPVSGLGTPDYTYLKQQLA